MKFKFPFLPASIRLNENDLKFFYYDVGLEQIDNLTHIVKISDNEISTFVKKYNIIIEKVDNNETISRDLTNIGINQIVLKCMDKENEAMAIIRHLRNAFAHYRIRKNENLFFINDFMPNQTDITMLACIEDKLLYELVHLIVYIKEEFREQIIIDCYENTII